MMGLALVVIGIATLASLDGDVVVCALKPSSPDRIQELRDREQRLLSLATKMAQKADERHGVIRV